MVEEALAWTEICETALVFVEMDLEIGFDDEYVENEGEENNKD